MIKKPKKESAISKHMKQFGDRYNPRTKILTTQKGERLKKYAHGYFNLHRFNSAKITPKVKKLFESYRLWILEQKQIKTEDFQFFFTIMVQAHPKELSYFQEEGSQLKILRTIEHVRFPYLKEIQIHNEQSVNFESIAWIQAPLLEQIYIQSKGVFTGIGPLAKTNFKNLQRIKLQVDSKELSQRRNIDLTKLSRTRMLHWEKLLDKFSYLLQSSVSLFRQDVSNVAFISKFQLQRLPNFSIPQLFQTNGVKSLNMEKIFESLNKKFSNMTFYHKVPKRFFGIQDNIYQIDFFEDDDSLGDYVDNDSDYSYHGRYSYEDIDSPYDSDF